MKRREEIKLNKIDVKVLDCLKNNTPKGLRVSVVCKLIDSKQRVVYKRLNILRDYNLIEHNYPLWNFKEKNIKGITKLKEGGKLFLSFKEGKILNIGSKKCYFCGFNKVLDRHHIKERKNGGKDVISNLLYLCPNCHQFLHRKGYNLIKVNKRFLMVDEENNILMGR